MFYLFRPIIKFFGFFSLAGFLLFFVFLVPVFADESKTIERLIELTEPRGHAAQEKEARLNAGEKAYLQFCVHCHGGQGQGDGKASGYLRPLPRDLSLGIFKFRSTPSNAIPRDEDLYQTIKKGVPGTAMPAWGEVLTEETLASLVEYIKNFSSRFEIETPDFKMPVGLEPPYENRSIEKGRILYKELRCGRCHGESGERSGRLENKLTDAWGNPSVVYDLKQPWLYKAGSSSEEICHTLVTGMDGTPMSAYDYVPAGDLWHLVHFLKSQQSGEKIPSAQMSQKLISHPTSKKFNLSPEDSVWNEVESVPVKLRSLQSAIERPSIVHAQSLHNSKQIAFRLKWKDESPETAQSGGGFYMDAAALQFSSMANFDSIYYGMGENQKSVNIWHWKADSFQEGHGQINSGKKVSVNPFSEKSVEEMNASGFGTLTVQSLEDQQLVGEGAWKDGWWTVVFLRNLKTESPFDIQFLKPRNILIAFALWNGKQKEKNANKKVSFWQQLVIP
ncbi:MAG: ethylbenzene dehydrogenase-related protein [Nitrospinota bacterium]